ncbi:MAG: ABC transporter ATP-binding protein [Anaerolineae bacterium]
MAAVALRAEGLTKRYGSLTAVDGLNLEVHLGEIFGFLGPNGAGKTTAINMICGLLRPDAGMVLIGERPVDWRDSAVRTRVGVCPQEIVLWRQLTCMEQLEFVGHMYGVAPGELRRRAEGLLAELDLGAKRDKLAQTLSGGMQRRLNLALALIHDPEIVVLDEPEAGLDPQSRVLVREYIRSLARRKTVILTTHNMDEAERTADRVAIIDHGRLLALDTPEALRHSVGEGDTVEIRLPGGASAAEAARAALAGVLDGPAVRAGGDGLTIRALNAVTLLPAVLEALAAAGIHCSDVSLRQSSLEDAFIRLTGRGLRE